MKKQNLLTTMLLLFALIVGSTSAWAAEEVYSTCLFGSNYNSKGVSGYTGVAFDVTNGDFTWNVINANNNNNQWNFVKFGGKNGAYTGSITNETAYSEAITKVVVTIDAITASSVNSIKLYTGSSTSAMTEAGTFTKATGAQTVTLSSPAEDLFYKIVFDCAKGTGNGLVTVSKVEFYYNNASGDTPAPSISADDVDITYDATNGSIAYTINNEPDPAGTLTAAITAGNEGDWLAIGTISSTVGLTCSANPAAAARTATVTLTYTYGDESTIKEVTVTQAGNPDAVNNISDINAVGTSYKVKGTVVATNARGFVIGDGTGYVYTYLGSAPTQSIGDKVTITGTTGSYGHIIQFTNTAMIAVAENSNYDNTPAITVVDATAIATYNSDYQLSDYVQFEGTLTKITSGNNTNYEITVGTETARISYPTTAQAEALDALLDKNVRVKGYFAGFSSTKFTVMMESAEEIVIPTHELTVNVDGEEGGVDINNTPASGVHEIAEGTSVTAKATPNTHYTFTSWTATGVTLENASDNPLTFTMPAGDVTLTANFTEDAKHTATFYVQGTLVNTDANVYEGEAITFPANPDAPDGYTFMGWTTSAISGEQNEAPTLVTSANMNNADIALYAVFAIGTGSGEDTYEKLSSNAFDTNATYVIAGKQSSTDDTMYYLQSYNNTTDANVDWGYATETPSTVTPVKFTLSGTAALLVAQDDSGNYLTCNSVKKFAMSSTSTTVYLDENGAIKSASEGNLLRYNYNQGAGGFRWYASTTGTQAYFYKVIPGVTYSDYCTTVPVEVTITPAYAKTTYVTTKKLDFTQVNGLDAYVATSAAAAGVTMTKVEAAVPAGTPLMLVGTVGTSYNVPVVTTATAPATNLLLAGDGTTTFDGSTYDYILFSDGKFYLIGEGTVPVGKAYLHLDSAPSGARELAIIFEDESTGIAEMQTVKNVENGKFYNLNGQQVAQPTKGLYIVNGKKYIVK